MAVGSDSLNSYYPINWFDLPFCHCQLPKLSEGKIDDQWFYGCQNDNRPKRVARSMQGGLINIWRFSRVCNVFQEGREEGSIVELVGLVYLVGQVTRAEPDFEK